MKVIVIDPQKSLNYCEVAYDLVCLDSVDQMRDISGNDVDILVLNDKVADLSLIDIFTKENVWKICVHESFEADFPIEKWKEFCLVEIIKSDFDFNKLRSLEDSTALIKSKINFKDKFNFDSEVNQRLQLAIDKVFKNDLDKIEDRNMSDDNSGLKIKVPSEQSSASALDITLDLGEDSAIHDSIETPIEDNGFDMGELDASALSLSEDAGTSDTLEAVALENVGDLDFSESSSPAFSLHDKGDEVESISTDDELSVGEEDLDASINDLDGIDDFEDLDLSADGLEEIDDLDDVVDTEEGFSLSDDVGEKTAKTEVTTSDELKKLQADARKVEPVEADTFEKSANALPDVKALPIRADETGEIDIANLLGQTGSTEVERINVKEEIASENYASVNSRYSAEDLLDIKITLSELKDDRKSLLDEITNLEQTKDQLLRQNLNLKADLDELKIELSIMKKRHIAELEDYKHQNSLLLEKREILDAKNKNYQREIERLGSKIRIDFSKIKQREKELEGQLELVSIDADSKVKSRDLKILELKRKIDALEFNMENISIKEKQSVQDKSILEDKLNRVVGTLRNSLSLLEQDIDISEITKSFKNENDL